MSALRTRRPGNRRRTRINDIPTPNNTLMATATTDTYSVSFSALVTSGSERESHIACQPLANACLATSATGHATRKNKYPMAMTRSR
jgi:hypothetical protein